MSVASNQRRIPGNLYTVVKVVRSIHIDLNKEKLDESLPLSNLGYHIL